MRTPDPFMAPLSSPDSRALPAPLKRAATFAEIYIPPHSSGLHGFAQTVKRLMRRFCCGV
ncbi:MAG: hypothetical protein LDL37_07405 [Asticcacaulis sp.]|uniref:hypothetical protein n=1 Tax=Asticcacaulis sp. TaxID=1872648 RepID=UPI0025C20EAD|nr:hypothetical protein [Asticcacaulis sp.]MCA1935262.1 hypothetical protein [Asticcacaulis sp.]